MGIDIKRALLCCCALSLGTLPAAHAEGERPGYEYGGTRREGRQPQAGGGGRLQALFGGEGRVRERGTPEDLDRMRSANQRKGGGALDAAKLRGGRFGKPAWGSGEARYVYLGVDPHGRSQSDPAAKFVIIRDLSALGAFGEYVQQGRPSAPFLAQNREVLQREHVLGVVTPRPGEHQPVHLHDVDRVKGPAHLGRMFRAVLEYGDKTYGDGVIGNWGADISLGGRVAVDALHVHGRRQDGAGPGVADWWRFLQGKGYTALETQREGGHSFQILAPAAGAKAANGWELVVLAKDVAPRDLTAAHDALLGKMILAAYDAATKRDLRLGEIQVVRADKQLAVRVHTFGGAFGGGALAGAGSGGPARPERPQRYDFAHEW